MKIEFPLSVFLEKYNPINHAYWKLYREDKITQIELRFKRLEKTFEAIDHEIAGASINEISDKYNLPLDLDAPINTLSAGQKQRVEIVRILLQDPELLIMDEPTSVLTPQEVESLFKTLNTLLKEGRTILYITHKLEEVINLCEEVTILRDGSVIESSKLENE